jgi:PHD/YefM family antitoxin component YafN of YafNO toxin-antitoxin module
MPQIIEKKGRKDFVAISYKEWQTIKEAVEDYEDLMDLRKAKKIEKNKNGKSIDKIISELKPSK